MKTCTMLAYYVGYDANGNAVCDGNHSCKLETDEDYFDATMYMGHTIEHLIEHCKSENTLVSRVVLKHVQMM